MRLRRSALAVVTAIVLLSACGQDAPEFGSSPDARPATDAAAYDRGENAAGSVGQTAGTMAPSTTESDVSTGPDPAVQAICDRVSILLVTASGLGPDPSRADAQMLDESGAQLLDDGALIYDVLSAADQSRLRDCLDQAVEATD